MHATAIGELLLRPVPFFPKFFDALSDGKLKGRIVFPELGVEVA
jgi:hypothetical protein